MHLSSYALLVAVVASSSSATTHTRKHEAKDRSQQLKIPAIWKSPLFKSGAGPPGLDAPGSLPFGSPPTPLTPPSSQPSPPKVPSSASPPKHSSLQENFQVHQPAPILTVPALACSVTLVDRSFTNSYGSPSYLSFDPHFSFAGSACADPAQWTGLTLDIHGETRGRQFDRLGTVWVGNNRTGQGVEVFRLDNPEPTRQGVYWDVNKDVGKYYSLFSEKADVIFDLPNIVDSTYTGALNVTLKLTASVDGFIARRGLHRRGASADQGHKTVHSTAASLKGRAADVVFPLSKRLQTDNSVFQVGGSAGNGTTPVTFPRNAARAVVEVYASGTASEEFWYTGLPDKYYNQIPGAAENGYYGHGPYREVQLYIDGTFAGFVTPYPIIFTGGINPLLWRPSANYGTFDQPTYNIDITPFLGQLTDDKEHSFELAVVSSEVGGAINDASWFVSGNVQVYLDSSEERTTGKVVKMAKGAEVVDGYTTGSITGDPLGNGTLTYEVGLKQPRSFGVAGTIKTGSGLEYVAGWYQSAKYSNTGFVNATAQTNDQTSSGWTRSVVLDNKSPNNVLDDDLSSDDLQTLENSAGVHAVQLDYNYPLYVASFLSNAAFDAQVTQQFDRTIQNTIPSRASPPRADLGLMVGDETTFVHAKPAAALPHTILSRRKEEAVSVLMNGAIVNGTGTSEQSFMYKDMAGGTIDRETRTNTTSVLEDRLAGSVRGRAQPGQLRVV